MGAVSSPWHGQWRTQWERGREGEEWVRSGKVILSRVQSSCGSASCSVCHAMTWGDVMCMPLGAPEFRISRGERMRGRGLGRGQSVVVREGEWRAVSWSYSSQSTASSSSLCLHLSHLVLCYVSGLFEAPGLTRSKTSSTFVWFQLL